MKKQILMIIMTVLLLGGCNRKQEWQLHYEQAEKLAEEGNHGLALEQMDAAIALKSDDPALYLMRAYCHIYNRGKEKGKVTIDPVSNYDQAMIDLQHALDLDPDNEDLKQEIAQGRKAAEDFREAINNVAGESLIKEAVSQENVGCTPVWDVDYAYTKAYFRDGELSTCTAYDDKDRAIYQDNYHIRADGKDVLHARNYYDGESDRIIRQEYRYDSTPDVGIYEGKNFVKIYEYDENGNLMTATYHHVDDRIMGIDHYVQGILAYTEDIDLKTGEVTIIEHDPLLSTPAEELEDWEKEYELAIGFSNSGDHTGTIEHLSEAIRLSPDKAFLYTNRAAEYLRASFNGKDLSVEDPRKIYDLVSEDLKKAEELLQEGEEPAVSVEFVRDLLEDWKKIVSFEG
ncbi:MAG: hypothetical protein IKQ98_00255 [Erysipelotrichaceae bacterium]|nr:hypothetical protein [Erysipelotrichaceae bacterium]